MTLDTTVDNFFSSRGPVTVLDALILATGLAEAHIQFVEMKEGSVIVTYDVLKLDST